MFAMNIHTMMPVIITAHQYVGSTMTKIGPDKTINAPTVSDWANH
jgi:hypothetical protein